MTDRGETPPWPQPPPDLLCWAVQCSLMNVIQSLTALCYAFTIFLHRQAGMHSLTTNNDGALLLLLLLLL